MHKLKIKADPSFKVSVAIPIPGGDSVPLELTFRHKTKKELQGFMALLDTLSEADIFLEMVSAWELDEPFTKENVAILIDGYHGAVKAVADAYFMQLYGVRCYDA